MGQKKNPNEYGIETNQPQIFKKSKIVADFNLETL